MYLSIKSRTSMSIFLYYILKAFLNFIILLNIFFYLIYISFHDYMDNGNSILYILMMDYILMIQFLFYEVM